ncbi:hypothetical protein SAMN05720781_1770 [Fibrobacter sp. UWT3]|nr:hypothetical protein SAMN05720781_1770 [Fibrobacter sp. UWT3]
MKKLIALCSFVFLLCSCAGVNVKQPDIGNVKKVAGPCRSLIRG